MTLRTRVRRDADALVQLPLLFVELDGAYDLGLRRQLRRHLVLEAAEDERRHALAELLEALRVALHLDRVSKRVRKAPPAQQARHQQVEERPQLAELFSSGVP
jgi:hypothetical protein